MDIVYSVGVDNAALQAGLARNQAMVAAHIAAMNTKVGAIGSSGFAAMAGGAGHVAKVNSAMERAIGLTGRFGQALDKMGGQFTNGLGIGATLGGLALLERAFTLSIEKARQFQTAHLAIAASLQSAYKLTGANGQEITGAKGFAIAKAKGEEFNQEIIRRQARNILVYQEQLGAFQSSIAAGSRKGLTPEQVLDTSEQAAIVAKTLGLRGEQIANASRLLMGGGVNVGRSTIGRALGISNKDISSRSGDEFQEFLASKMKGFKAAEPDFAKSIEGILSTLEAKFDIFFAKVGGKFMANITPAIEGFTKAFEGENADKFATTLSDLFTQLFNVLKAIIDSGALGVIAKGLEFLSKWGKDIVIAAVLMKLVGTVATLGTGLGAIILMLRKVSTTAIEAAAGLTSTAIAADAVNGAAGRGMLPGGSRMAGIPMGLGPRAAAASGVMTAAERAAAAAILSGTAMPGRLLTSPTILKAGGMPIYAPSTGNWGAPGTGGVTNLKQYPAQYDTAIQKEVAAARASGATGGYYGPTSAMLPPPLTVRQQMGAYGNTWQGAKYAAGTTMNAAGGIMMGGMGGMLAGQLIKSQTDQMGGASQKVGNALATALPVAGAIAMVPGVGIPVAGAVLAAVTAIKLFTAAMDDIEVKAKKATLRFNELADDAFKPDEKPQTPKEKGRKDITNKYDTLLAKNKEEEDKLSLQKTTGLTAEGEKNIWSDSLINKGINNLRRKRKDLLNQMDAAIVVNDTKSMDFTELGMRQWKLGDDKGEEEYLVGKGRGTAYKRDLQSQYDKAKLDTYAAAGTELAKTDMSPGDIVETLKLVMAKFEKDFNWPLKELAAQTEMLSLGDKAENAGALAELAFATTENKINDMAEVYGSLVDAAAAHRQNKARRAVDRMNAADTATYRSVLGGTDTDRIVTEGKADLTVKENRRRMNIADAGGNKYFNQLGGIYNEYGAGMTGGMFKGNEGTQFVQDKLGTFVNGMNLDYLGQGKTLNSLTRQKEDLIANRPGIEQNIKFAGLNAGFAAEEATMAKENWAADTAPQFADAAAAIKWKVRAEMGQKEGFDPAQYEENAKRQLDIDKSKVSMAAEAATLASESIDVDKQLMRAKNDYQTAMQELTIQMREQAKVYATLGAARTDILNSLTGKSGGGTNNTVTVNIGGGKMGMDETQIRSLATQVKTALETECRRANARK